MQNHSQYTSDAFKSDADDKCVSCAHNIGDAVMNCEYACTGVEEIADEGRVVVLCNDYEPKPNKNIGRSTV